MKPLEIASEMIIGAYSNLQQDRDMNNLNEIKVPSGKLT